MCAIMAMSKAWSGGCAVDYELLDAQCAILLTPLDNTEGLRPTAHSVHSADTYPLHRYISTKSMPLLRESGYDTNNDNHGFRRVSFPS